MLDRYLQILDAIVEAGQPLLATDVAAACDLPLSTTYRLLRQLGDSDLVAKGTDQDTYWLGLKCLAYGGAVLKSLRIRDIAVAEMRKLSDAVGETVHLTVRDRDYGVFIEKISPPNQVFQWHTEIGRRMSLCMGASMKILLAHLEPAEQEAILDRADLSGAGPGVTTDRVVIRQQLDQIRQQGWVLTNEELNAGAAGLSAPVRDWSDTVVAGLTVTSPLSRLSPTHVQEILPSLLKATSEISRSLGNKS